MKIMTSYKKEVVKPNDLPQKEDHDKIEKPWCEAHETFYYMCDCPKPDSTIERDGWHVMEIRGKLVAYPSIARYEAMALWIEAEGSKVKCNRCEKEIDLDKLYYATENLYEEYNVKMKEIIFESFFDDHTKCKGIRSDDKEEYLVISTLFDRSININILRTDPDQDLGPEI